MSNAIRFIGDLAHDLAHDVIFLKRLPFRSHESTTELRSYYLRACICASGYVSPHDPDEIINDQRRLRKLQFFARDRLSAIDYRKLITTFEPIKTRNMQQQK